jgi:hypothetical protein
VETIQIMLCNRRLLATLYSCVVLLASTGAFVLHRPTNVRLPSALAATVTKTTLTDATNWKLRLVLRGVTTEKGKKVDEVFSLTTQFIEEEGYEPPQGDLKQVVGEGESPLIKIVSSRWQLSEDPNDRKDGLWIWGLFKEPLYPFLLLQVKTDLIPLSTSENEEADRILPLELYAQINHRRDDDKGVILEASDLKVRQMESIKADPFGAAKVDIFEEVSIGTISVQPML